MFDKIWAKILYAKQVHPKRSQQSRNPLGDNLQVLRGGGRRSIAREEQVRTGSKVGSGQVRSNGGRCTAATLFECRTLFLLSKYIERDVIFSLNYFSLGILSSFFFTLFFNLLFLYKILVIHTVKNIRPLSAGITLSSSSPNILRWYDFPLINYFSLGIFSSLFFTLFLNSYFVIKSW